MEARPQSPPIRISDGSSGKAGRPASEREASVDVHFHVAAEVAALREAHRAGLALRAQTYKQHCTVE